MPANRIGYRIFTLAQRKVIQEVVTIVVFAGFATLSMRQPLKLDHLWAGLCLVGASCSMFRSV